MTKYTSNNAPLVSVIMSVYNGEDFLEQAIDSILAQTFRNFEVIIINDGSSDSSEAIVKKYKDPRIRLVSQENHGLVYSFNKGISLARGEFIARMDADDISLPSRFEKELAWITASEKRGLVGSFFKYIDPNSKPTNVTMTSPTKHLDIMRMMYITNPFGHGSILMRKKAVLSVGGYRAGYEPAEDFDLWCRIATKWEIGQLPEVLYWWRIHGASISHTKQKIQHKASKRIIEEFWQNVIAAKSTHFIISDAKYYKGLNSIYQESVYHQYIDQQENLAFEFLVHGRLRSGYKTALALLWLKPKAFWSIRRTLLWAPFKYYRDFRKK